MEMNTKCANSSLFNFQNSQSFQYYNGDLEAVIPPIRALALSLLPVTTEILDDFWQKKPPLNFYILCYHHLNVTIPKICSFVLL